MVQYFPGAVWRAFRGAQLPGEVCQKGLYAKLESQKQFFLPCGVRCRRRWTELMNVPQSMSARASAVQIHGKWWSLPIQLRTKSCTFFCLKETESPTYILLVLLPQPHTLQQEGQMRQTYSDWIQTWRTRWNTKILQNRSEENKNWKICSQAVLVVTRFILTSLNNSFLYSQWNWLVDKQCESQPIELNLT